MWNINEAFLDQQAALHKAFYSSHSVVEATGSLGAEIDHLFRNYQIVVIQKFF